MVCATCTDPRSPFPSPAVAWRRPLPCVRCLQDPLAQTAWDTEPCRVEAVPASSGRHCRPIQDRDTATARSAFTSPSDASALLSKHRLRGNEIGQSLSRMNLVMSTLNLRSGNYVMWRPPKKDGPSCNFQNLILCRSRSMLS